ncbi:hypothetical protein [Pseudarthrobacter sp. BRE9]|uniref:hypothetical protein n=1 Tax=Pseudarthrobacter sp. BRE9 TaxID=2962582 RepID=UPI0028814A95|nr:hypothetical protein [Pseudarthrobacter sp. BRE9]MDT0168112.1 hypothetical protein [Pseudarthrobacter sp. BRE9]
MAAVGLGADAIRYRPGTDLVERAALLEGQLTATVQGEPEEKLEDLLTVPQERSGRLV